jgi:hypothetical protein
MPAPVARVAGSRRATCAPPHPFYTYLAALVVDPGVDSVTGSRTWNRKSTVFAGKGAALVPPAGPAALQKTPLALLGKPFCQKCRAGDVECFAQTPPRGGRGPLWGLLVALLRVSLASISCKKSSNDGHVSPSCVRERAREIPRARGWAYGPRYWLPRAKLRVFKNLCKRPSWPGGWQWCACRPSGPPSAGERGLLRRRGGLSNRPPPLYRRVSRGGDGRDRRILRVEAQLAPVLKSAEPSSSPRCLLRLHGSVREVDELHERGAGARCSPSQN